MFMRKNPLPSPTSESLTTSETPPGLYSRWFHSSRLNDLIRSAALGKKFTPCSQSPHTIYFAIQTQTTRTKMDWNYQPLNITEEEECRLERKRSSSGHLLPGPCMGAREN